MRTGNRKNCYLFLQEVYDILIHANTYKSKKGKMTRASIKALNGLRDLSTLQWYFVPLLALTFYVYTIEMKKAKETGNWNALFAGATLFGADYLNETLNGWILNISGHSALWTAPGTTALRTMVGWNIEIVFMFAILGIIYYNTIDEDKNVKILGVPNRWFWAIGYSAFSVFIEILLNKGGHLVWEYPFWNRSLKGIWLIFIFGYFWFFAITKFVIEQTSVKKKIAVIGSLYGAATLLNIIAGLFLGWIY